MSALRYALYSFTLLLALLLIGTISLPRWLPPLLIHWSEQRGLTIEQLELGYPGLRGWEIHALALRRQAPTPEVHFSASRIRLEYTLTELLHGRLDALTVPQAALSWQPTTAPNDPALSAPRAADLLGTLLPEYWLAQLPLQRIELQRLALRAPPEYAHLLAGHLNLRAQRQQGRLRLSAQLQQAERRFSLTGHLGQDNDIALTLMLDDTPWLDLQQRSQRVPGVLRLTGQLSLDLKAAPLLATYLAPTLPLQLQRPSGQARLSWQAQLPLEATRQQTFRQRGQATFEFRLQGQAEAVGPYLAQTDLFLHGSAAIEAEQLNWRLHEGSRLATLPVLTAWPLPETRRRQLQPLHDQPLIIQLPTALSGRWLSNHRRLQWQGELTLELGMPSHPLLRQRLRLIDLQLPTARDDVATATLHWHGELAGHALPDLPFNQAAWELALQGHYGNRLELQIGDASRLELAQLRHGELRIPRLALRPRQTLSLHYQPTQRHLRLDRTGALEIDLPILHGPSYRLSQRRASLQLNRLELDLAQAHWQARGALQLEQLQGEWNTHRVKPLQLDARFNANHDAVRVQAELHGTAPAFSARLDGRHAFQTQRGQATLTLPRTRFAPDNAQLSQLLERWPYRFDLTGGTLSAQGTFSWRRQPAFRLTQDRLTLTLDQLTGFYDDMTFSGLQGQLRLASVTALSSDGYQRLSLERLDTGIPIRQIQLHAAFERLSSPTPHIHLQRLDSRLLGGRAWSRDVELDFSRPDNLLPLSLEELQLSALLALEQQEGLSGSGVLDGQLPVRLSRSAITIDAGRLSARPPGGTIRYQPNAAAQRIARTNPQLRTAFSALSDFRYQVLDAGVDYLTDGTLQLNLQLQGRNPAFQRGRPIHFNLTLEENLPALLHSLKLADEISERVGKRFERR